MALAPSCWSADNFYTVLPTYRKHNAGATWSRAACGGANACTAKFQCVTAGAAEPKKKKKKKKKEGENINTQDVSTSLR